MQTNRNKLKSIKPAVGYNETPKRDGTLHGKKRKLYAKITGGYSDSLKLFMGLPCF